MSVNIEGGGGGGGEEEEKTYLFGISL